VKIYEFYERNTKLKDHVAIKFKDEIITYGELPKYVDSYAAYLQSLGVKKGDKVILSMPNCPEFIFAYLGSAKAGAITIPLNLMYTMEEIQYVVMESGANTIVVHPVVLKNVDTSAFSKLNLKNVVVLNDDTKKK